MAASPRTVFQPPHLKAGVPHFPLPHPKAQAAGLRVYPALKKISEAPPGLPLSRTLLRSLRDSLDDLGLAAFQEEILQNPGPALDSLRYSLRLYASQSVHSLSEAAQDRYYQRLQTDQIPYHFTESESSQTIDLVESLESDLAYVGFAEAFYGLPLTCDSRMLYLNFCLRYFGPGTSFFVSLNRGLRLAAQAGKSDHLTQSLDNPEINYYYALLGAAQGRQLHVLGLLLSSLSFFPGLKHPVMREARVWRRILRYAAKGGRKAFEMVRGAYQALTGETLTYDAGLLLTKAAQYDRTGLVVFLSAQVSNFSRYMRGLVKAGILCSSPRVLDSLLALVPRLKKILYVVKSPGSLSPPHLQTCLLALARLGDLERTSRLIPPTYDATSVCAQAARYGHLFLVDYLVATFPHLRLGAVLVEAVHGGYGVAVHHVLNLIREPLPPDLEEDCLLQAAECGNCTLLTLFLSRIPHVTPELVARVSLRAQYHGHLDLQRHLQNVAGKPFPSLQTQRIADLALRKEHFLPQSTPT